MIATLLFSAVAAGLVLLTGRSDKARDPRLTISVLILILIFPLLAAFFPKVEILPSREIVENSSHFNGLSLLFWAWSFGISIALIRLGLAAIGIARWRKNSHLLQCIDGVEIRLLDAIESPVAAGVLHRMIFVPQQWNQWSEENRQIILDHEMAHHHRRDPLWRWIAEITCAIHYYNPLVFWMSRRLTMQCEFACDARVVERGVPVTNYAQVLCDCAAMKPMRGPVLAMAERSSLESRVLRLVKPARPIGSATLIVLTVLALTMAGILASLAPEKKSAAPSISQEEIDLRWSANPFPGEG